MIAKSIIANGKPIILACDAKCHKAWGIQNRPKISFDPDCEDDVAYLADGELGNAPQDPGTAEGVDSKPTRPEDPLNRWCFRECERSVTAEPLEDFELKDFSVRRYNQPCKHTNGA